MISEEAMNAALVRELCSGRALMETRQKFREHGAAVEAKELRQHRTHAVLGKAVAVVPQHEFFLMREKYGEDCWGDKGFVRDFQKLEPTMAVHKI
jgi:hypothetical protein